MPYNSGMTTKVCSKCRTRKRVKYFPKQKDKPGGIHEHCRTCRNAYFRKHYRHMTPEKKAQRKVRMREYMCQWAAKRNAMHIRDVA